jgi:hypothetical protein
MDGSALPCVSGRWLSLLAAAIAFTLSEQAGLTGEVHKQTYNYKTVGTLPIKADVFRADDQAERPVVVWIHGGALINGHRESLLSRLKTRCWKRTVRPSSSWRLRMSRSVTPGGIPGYAVTRFKAATSLRLHAAERMLGDRGPGDLLQQLI